jgi:hypothetical protein
LLDLLENEGCFVLRRGTIEAYYLKSNKTTSIGKPAAAVEEVEHFDQLTIEEIQNAYGDAIRCIKSASASEAISESEAVRDLLLAAAAPAMAKLMDEKSDQEIQIIVKSILGDRSDIFKFQIQNGALEISVASKILDLKGFPLTLHKSDDIVKKISSALKSH